MGVYDHRGARKIGGAPEEPEQEPVCVEVRASCPKCESREYVQFGYEGNVIYRECRGCGHRGKSMRYFSTDVREIVLRD